MLPESQWLIQAVMILRDEYRVHSGLGIAVAEGILEREKRAGEPRDPATAVHDAFKDVAA